MDPITRNNIFMEHMNLINRTMHRNRPLLYALHLDQTMSIRNWLLPRCRPSTLLMPGVAIP